MPTTQRSAPKMRAKQALAAAAVGVSEFLCKRVGLQLTEMRSPN